MTRAVDPDGLDTPNAVHPDLPAEQVYVDHAFDCLKQDQLSAERLIRQEHAGANRHTVRALHEIGGRLLRNRRSAEDRILFGRIDPDEGEPLYIGRERISNPNGGPPVVIGWHVDAAIPFYEAHPDDPQGLVRKRRFELDGRKLVAIDDEVLKEAQIRTGGAVPQKPSSSLSDALLRDLERARSPEMRDIVPTIEREQFKLIRAPRDGVLVLQGGPGTGKTAVALHRAAWLAFNQRDLQTRGGVLVVGPNRAFMEYVAAVLPGLGLDGVTQSPVDRLVVAQDPAGRVVRSNRQDTRELAFLKGDPRMADVVAACVEQRVRPPDGFVEATFGGIGVRLSQEKVAAIIQSARGTPDQRRSYMEARTRFRNEMRALAAHTYREALGARPASLDESQLERALNAATGPWFNALERIWPTMSAPQLVHELYTVERRMRAAAAGILEDDEQQSLMRKDVGNVREHPWSTADLPIVDEADALLNGGRSRVLHGYVIVDEAQDMTPMQLRMAARRARGTSMTLVGDLAQTTGPWKYASWDQLVEQIPGAPQVQYAELVIGYRVPAPIMRIASGLLPRIAPDLTPIQAVRQGPAPTIESVSEEDLPIVVAAEAERLSESDRQVGVIAPRSIVQSLRAAFTDLGMQVGDIARDALGRQVTLLEADAAKGLEFDHVVVVEPGSIVEQGLHGLNELYVALTRATQRLSIVHSEALPGVLELPAPGGAQEGDRPAPVDRSEIRPATAPEAAPVPEEPGVAVLSLGGRFSEALVYAKLKHGNQARLGTAVPYLSHLLAVCALVLEDGGNEEEAIAALLHDAAEDHGGADAIHEIATRFGEGVAGVVAMCSDPVEVADQWRDVKQAHLETLETAPAAVRRVALAEKLDNARGIVRNLRELGPQMWPRMAVDPADLVWYFTELAALFSQSHPGAMADELASEVAELISLAGVDESSGQNAVALPVLGE